MPKMETASVNGFQYFDQPAADMMNTDTRKPLMELSGSPTQTQTDHQRRRSVATVSPLSDHTDNDEAGQVAAWSSPLPTPLSQHHARALSEQLLVPGKHFLEEQSMMDKARKSKPEQASDELEISGAGRALNDWWYWELGAASVSMTCISLLFLVLFKANGLPLSDWGMSIQPNSVIAILVTIIRTSMMVPLAACLSQLKWSGLLRHSGNLYSLQLFDDASRGPWGSFQMLINSDRKPMLAWFLAFVTVMALGMDSTAQQILEFPTRQVELTNITASMEFADDYTSKAFLERYTRKLRGASAPFFSFLEVP